MGSRQRALHYTSVGLRLWFLSVASCMFLAAIARVTAPSPDADVVFRVPEVLVRHAAAPRAVGTGRGNSSRVNDSDALAPDTLVVRYEEFFVEHDVSTVAARQAARALNLDEMAGSRPGCGSCSPREMEYCESRVLADHCCCERRFVAEPFGWLPHTCYLGAHRCRPYARDCAQYARLRDCCCYKKLAVKWKGILSRSGKLDCQSWCFVTVAALMVLLAAERL